MGSQMKRRGGGGGAVVVVLVGESSLMLLMSLPFSEEEDRKRLMASLPSGSVTRADKCSSHAPLYIEKNIYLQLLLLFVGCFIDCFFPI